MQMPMVARHVEEIPYAGIRKVFDKANRLEAQGTHVIHFEIGRPDFDTPLHIKQAAAQALDKGMVHYTPNVGVLGLREALSESIAAFKGIRYDPESEIMATAGGQESMYLGLQTFLNKEMKSLFRIRATANFTHVSSWSAACRLPCRCARIRVLFPTLRPPDNC